MTSSISLGVLPEGGVKRRSVDDVDTGYRIQDLNNLLPVLKKIIFYGSG
jgi:hypothetical protein